ncbi:MAG: Uma2 family endonuclease [Geminicoccaceae bacterium]
MAEPARALPMTVAEFVHWGDGSDIRYELAFGTPVAMAPPSGRHADIVANIIARLSGQLVRPCRIPVGGGVARGDNDDEFRLPDVIVSCEPTPRVYFRQPRLIVEVLSPSTEKEDRTDKLDFYRSLESVEAVVLVWQEKRRMQVVRREQDRWSIQDLVGGGDLVVTTLDLGLTLDEIYADIDFPAEDEPASP